MLLDLYSFYFKTVGTHTTQPKRLLGHMSPLPILPFSKFLLNVTHLFHQNKVEQV